MLAERAQYEEQLEDAKRKLRLAEEDHTSALKKAVAAKEEEMEEERKKAVATARADGQQSGQTESAGAAKRELEEGSW